MKLQTRSSQAPLTLEVSRGPLVESRHQISAVLLDQNASVVKSWGEPQMLTYPRSSIKPLQVLPFLDSGAFAKLGGKLEYLALGSASHRGEDIHVNVLKKWAEEIDVHENELACGPVNGTRFRHNCSGKHMAALSVCRENGWSIKDYNKFEHPVQMEIRKFLNLTMGFNHDRAQHGVDGCSFPTVGIPMQNFAQGFLTFVSNHQRVVPVEFTDLIQKAILTHPDLYSGSDDIARAIIQNAEGRVLFKCGAEGTCGAWFPDKKMSLAIKVMDGGMRAVWVTLIHIMQDLNLINHTQFNALLDHPMIATKNSRGDVIGSYRVQNYNHEIA